jgi:aminoglycoside phosphotransferase (APT) family kinase protein
MITSIPSEILSGVPGCGSGQAPDSIQALTGGRGVNSVWQVRTTAGNFVLRLRHEPVDRPGSASQFELASHRLAAAAGLAPQVVNAAPDGRWLVMDFVDEAPWTDAQLLSDAGIDALGEALGCLHALSCQDLPRIDVAAIAHGYLAEIEKHQPDPASVAAEVSAIELVSRELNRLSDRAVLNHGDLMAANLLGPAAGAHPMLVDWEYAQRADPTWDVACLLAYYPGLEARLARLLAACGLPTTDDWHILSLQRRLFAGINCLWQQAEAGNWIS